MEQIEIKRTGAEDIDLVAPLWDKLRMHHHDRSIHFKDKFLNMTWDMRKCNILKNAVDVLVDYAVEKSTDQIIGFCATVIRKEGDNIYGEIESLYIYEKCRKTGLGKKLLENAVSWLNSHEIETQKIVVSAGNEEVLDFYAQFGFQPIFIVLQNTKQQ